jgi:Family of unknown function (DUF6236)
LAGVHESEIEPELQERLCSEGLAIDSRVGFLAMYPDLAWIYKCHFTDQIARRNRLMPTTDQLEAHAFVADLGPGNVVKEDRESDIATSFGLLAIEMVIPSDLSSVPISKIIEVRRRFGADFDRWRHHVDELGSGIAEQLRDVESPDIVSEYLDDALRRYAKQPLGSLKRGLSEVGLDIGMAAINTKFDVPAGVALVGLGGGSAIAAAGGVAAGVVNLCRRAKVEAQAKMAVPATYLLDVSQTLSNKSLMQRVILVMRRAAGLSG